MVVAVYYQFALGALALLLRFSDRPVRRCFRGCFSCCTRCCGKGRSSRAIENRSRQTFCGCLASTPPIRLILALLFPLLWVLSKFRLRWYWFHLAMQVGFLYREALIIKYYYDEKQEMRWEALAAHLSIWISLVLVLGECWRFSAVRDTHTSGEAIDQVLDMVLLPVNYGFFCSLCVRILVLQSDHQNKTMVGALMESADIWEAWALWSVLTLFVRVVDFEASIDAVRANDADYQRFIHHFKGLSIQGVKLWVIILTLTIAFNVLMEGAVSLMAPTLCYWAYKECLSCEEWYGEHYKLAASSVLYILCCFALVFVFTFERIFQEYLHGIKPVWKFWGVKGVVSVTYFQYLVLVYGLRLSSEDATLWHCLLCCIEMPLLSLVHQCKAYPCGKDEAWVASLLRSCQPMDEETVEARTSAKVAAVLAEVEARHSLQRSRDESPASNSGLADAAGALPTTSPSSLGASGAAASSSSAPADTEGPAQAPAAARSSLPAKSVGRSGTASDAEGDEFREELAAALSRPNLDEEAGADQRALRAGGLDPSSPTRGDGDPDGGSEGVLPASRESEIASNLTHLLLFGASCYICKDFIFWLVPVEQDIEEAPPVWVFTCAQQSTLETYVSEQKEKHWQLPGAVLEEYRAGLPLCSKATVGCARGYTGSPTITCSAEGHYTPAGVCTPSECGEPETLPHATVSFDDKAKHDFSQGVRIKYTCDPGYVGAPVAECGKKKVGEYFVEGECKEVLCATPPTVPHATALMPSNGTAIRLGTVVSYQCEEGYLGTPVANCTDVGSYTLEGDRCLVDCGAPPKAELATPIYAKDKKNFVEGTRVDYECIEGYGGTLVAVCGQSGKWEQSGACVRNCGAPISFKHASPVMSKEEKAMDHWPVGKTVHYACERGYKGSPIAECSSDGNWHIEDNDCAYIGCGPVDDFLKKTLGAHWGTHVQVNKKMSTSLDTFEDVIVYDCLQGAAGRPVATCSNGEWGLTGECRKAHTSMGCQCKESWVTCSGWFSQTCLQFNGCKLPDGKTDAKPYGWCMIDKDSCDKEILKSAGTLPEWDFCAASGDIQGTTPQTGAKVDPPEGIAGRAVLALLPPLALLVTILATLFWLVRNPSRLARLGAPRRSPILPSQSTPLGTGGARASPSTAFRTDARRSLVVEGGEEEAE